jgi:hypothetical protein
MAWVFLMLGWLVATVLRARRATFALGAFVSALVVLAALTLANPAGIIVRTNTGRVAAALPKLDVDYLVDLGPDAVPGLIAVLDDLQSCQTRSDLAYAVLRAGDAGFGPAGEDWRSLTWSRWRAEQAFDDAEPHLLAVASGACP